MCKGQLTFVISARKGLKRKHVSAEKERLCDSCLQNTASQGCRHAEAVKLIVFLTSAPHSCNSSWEKLEGAIIQIFNENAGELSFEELYRTGYNMVLHKHGDMLYNNVDATLKRRSMELCERVEKNPDET